MIRRNREDLVLSSRQDLERQQEGSLPPSPSRGRTILRVALGVGSGLLILFFVFILPIPGPISRVREAWIQHAAEHRARVEGYEKNGWPDDESYYAVKGRIVLLGPSSNVTLNASSCESGQREIFYGVTLKDHTQPDITVRVVLPETGKPHITVHQRDKDDVVFESNVCSLWDVSITATDTPAKGKSFRDLAGHANVQCSLREASLQGALRFRNCR